MLQPETPLADPDLVALGLDEPALDERQAAKLIERYRGNDVLAAYFTAIEHVESEAVLEIAKMAPAPAMYLAYVDEQEEADASALSLLRTRWQVLMLLPMPATLTGPALRSRSRLVQLVKRLTIGEVPGILENDDDPDWALAYRISRWERVNAARPRPGNAALVTNIGFELESKIGTITREVG